MHYRHVGHSGLNVSVIGLGTWGWAESTDAYEAEAILGGFLDAGGTLVDTAAHYAAGDCEQLVGKAIEKLRHEVIIATKAGITNSHRDTSRKNLLDTLNQSLRRLRTDVIDIWQIAAWDKTTPLEETMEAISLAVSAGKVHYVGVSNFSAWQQTWFYQWAKELGVRLISNQVEYSLLNRSIEKDIVPASNETGMGILAWSPLGRGVLTGKYRLTIPGDSRAASANSHFVEPYLPQANGPIVESLAKAAEGLGLSMTDVALGWVLRNSSVSSAIVGARTYKQLIELMNNTDIEIPEAIYFALNDVSERA